MSQRRPSNQACAHDPAQGSQPTTQNPPKSAIKQDYLDKAAQEKLLRAKLTSLLQDLRKLRGHIKARSPLERIWRDMYRVDYESLKHRDGALSFPRCSLADDVKRILREIGELLERKLKGEDWEMSG